MPSPPLPQMFLPLPAEAHGGYAFSSPLGVLASLPAEVHGWRVTTVTQGTRWGKVKVVALVGRDGGSWRFGGQRDGLLNVHYGGMKKSR